MLGGIEKKFNESISISHEVKLPFHLYDVIVVVFHFVGMFIVSDKHQFKNNSYVYCFRYDDNTFREKPETVDVTAQGVRIYCRLHGLFDPLIR